MQGLLALLFFPIVWPIVTKVIWSRDINGQEMTLNVVLVVLLVIGVWYAGMSYQTHDTEIWNGRVTGKERERVACSHSYSCHCRRDKNGSETCDTCYEHSHDYDWVVHSDAGDFKINRIDRQGRHEPPRFTAVQKKEPVAQAHSFTNYVKAVPETILRKQGLKEKFATLIPAYPDAIYDYHHLDRVFGMGVTIPNLAGWNEDLANTLRWIGPSKQANVIVVFVGTTDQQYSYALEEAWVGGKKNDIIIVVGMMAYPHIDWVRVVSWSDKEIFKVQLRDDILDMEDIDRPKFMELVETHTRATFARKHMAEFEYLKYQIDPPTWVIILAACIAIGGSIGLSWYFRKNDVRFF